MLKVTVPGPLTLKRVNFVSPTLWCALSLAWQARPTTGPYHLYRVLSQGAEAGGMVQTVLGRRVPDSLEAQAQVGGPALAASAHLWHLAAAVCPPVQQGLESAIQM